MDLNQLIPPKLQKDKPDDYELWPEHWLAWDVYLGCGTQWRKTVLGGGMRPTRLLWEGLDYGGVEVVMRRYRVPEDRADEVFAQLQVLEAETCSIHNTQAAQP